MHAQQKISVDIYIMSHINSDPYWFMKVECFVANIIAHFFLNSS